MPCEIQQDLSANTALNFPGHGNKSNIKNFENKNEFYGYLHFDVASFDDIINYISSLKLIALIFSEKIEFRRKELTNTKES
jgi:hypothetical protein